MSVAIPTAAPASPAVAADAAPATGARALHSRFVDFWVLGGASLVVWAAMLAGSRMRDAVHPGPIDGYFLRLGTTALVLQLVGNNPHFMASYRLAWERGRGFWLRHWFSLLVVPLATFAVVALIYRSWQSPGFGAGAAASIEHLFSLLGLNAPAGFGASPGATFAAAFMDFGFLTVGWHYSKQVYGCMLVYARYDGYPLDATQRRWLKAALFSIWAWSWIYLNTMVDRNNEFGLVYVGLGVRPSLYLAGLVLFVVTTGGALASVVLRNLRAGHRPGVNFLIPWIAFIAWWAPSFNLREFTVWLVPLFHSLQYLLFVERVERKRSERARNPALVRAAVAGGLCIAGLLVFDLIPWWLDRGLGTSAITGGALLFLGLAATVVNVQHYFIDSVIWRMDDAELRRRLFEA